MSKLLKSGLLNPSETTRLKNGLKKFKTVKWICPERIHPTEKVDPIKAAQIANVIRKSFTVKAISVCSKTHAVIDGNHRYVAMRSLGVSQIPVCEVDYSDPSIEVITSLAVTKEMITSGRVFPQKSLIHYYRDGPHIETRMPFCELPQNFRPALSSLLRTGADSRISNKRTRYGTNLDRIDSIQLGSCTASELTESSFKLAESTLVMNTKYPELMSDIRRRLRDYFSFPSKVGVFLTPCGTSAELVPPLLLASRKVTSIINVLTMASETGSGSIKAAAYQPFDYRCADGSTIDEPICADLADKVKVITIDARNADGSPKDQKAEVQKILLDNPDAFIIRHVVAHSKTGLTEDPFFEGLPKDRTMVCVDACQARMSTNQVQDWVRQGMVVLFTGSKFFQAPPFCGAVFVPPNFCPGPLNFDIGRLGSYFDTESVLPAWRGNFPSTENWGLAIRWSIALSNMEAYSKTSRADSRLQQWHTAHADMLRSISQIQIYPSPDPTIICFSIDNHDFKLLQNVYRKCVEEGCIFGQPVKITPTFAILRLAFGVNDALADLDRRSVQRVARILQDAIETTEH